jgi:hypothetical protein
VLILTMFGRAGYLRRAMESGALGSRDDATVADIAAELFLSDGTVRNDLSSAIAKAGTATGSRPSAWPRSAAGSGEHEFAVGCRLRQSRAS